MLKYRRPSRQGNGIPVFVDGVRSAFVKSFGVFEDADTLELTDRVVNGLLAKISVDPLEIDEIINGAVIPQTKNPNIARDSILSLGLPRHIHGYNINRACTSSLQATVEAMKTIAFGHPDLIIASGVECLSDVPIVYSKDARKFMLKLSKAKGGGAKLAMLKNFKAKAWLPTPPALAEPLTGLSMGEHAELMALKNKISRADQDEFALRSHQKAAAAQQKGYFKDEIVPIWPKSETCVKEDNLVRGDTSLEALAKLSPAFDKKYGTLTAGNSSPLTDGASAGLIGDEKVCRDLGLKPKLKLVDFDFVGIDPKDQLLIGPAITIPRILRRNGMSLNDVDRLELHEAFAAQSLACLRSMASDAFCEEYFGNSKAFGTFDESRLNVNGGAIAIGHPFGATGMRLLTTLGAELIRSNKEVGLIAICAAGGMAGSMLVKRI